MKDELTELMHSEFTVSEEIDIKNKVGSAIESAMLRGGGEEGLRHSLPMYSVTFEEYERRKDYWAEVDISICH